MATPNADYSKFLSSRDYIKNLIHHRHIRESDIWIISRALQERTRWIGQDLRIGDWAGGPGRLTFRLAKPGTSVTLVDTDPNYLAFARETCAKGLYGNVQIVQADICEYVPEERPHVVILQGVLHHLNPEQKQRFLPLLSQTLAPGGVVIVSDEVLAEYPDTTNRRERERRRVIAAGIWYSYIIGSAKMESHPALARDECLIYGDDVLQRVLNDQQIEVVLDRCVEIKRFAEAIAPNPDKPDEINLAMLERAQQLSWQMFVSLRRMSPGGKMDVSSLRGDFKDRRSDVRAQVSAEFEIIEEHSEGPLSTIGAMYMAVLKVKV